jgi:molybdenum cofactor cytidylyltransferase
MGAGGLLAEIPTRPAPRAEAGKGAPAGPRAPTIAGLVLAAGQSRRMGTRNKLLIEIDGKPMVRHTVEAALASGIAPVAVVLGHESDAVEAALAGLPVRFAKNPDYASGLSTSLRRGLAEVPAEADGLLVALGDMPFVAGADIKRLLAAFNPLEGRAIIVPTRGGKRGNPVLWARRFFEEMAKSAGDSGAKHLIGAYPELVTEIEIGSDGVLLDIDTPQALAAIVGKNFAPQRESAE